MHCDSCETLLDEDDNYCRKCGAAVQIAQVPAVRQSQPPALFRSTAAPLATGAATVAAAALLRWAVGRAVNGLLSSDDRSRRAVQPARRSLLRRESAPEPPAEERRPRETVEVLWYRRTIRD